MKTEAMPPATMMSQALAAAVADACAVVSHNLNGQRLGPKGRSTRERILSATIEMLEEVGEDQAITLSAVARRASLGMTSLYNYFTDLTELLLAVLEPVMATAETAYLSNLRGHWPDGELGSRAHTFLRGYFDFWSRHARLLHLRNSMSDSRDERMLQHRVTSTQPIISLLADQIDPGGGEAGTSAYAMATILMTGIERTVTVGTDSRYSEFFDAEKRRPADYYLKPEARLMELAIRDTRNMLARGENF